WAPSPEPPMLSEYIHFLTLLLAAGVFGALIPNLIDAGRALLRIKPAPLEDDDSPKRPELHLAALLEPLALLLVSETDRAYFRSAVSDLLHIRQMQNPTVPAVIGALRRMNAYAFEELVA